MTGEEGASDERREVNRDRKGEGIKEGNVEAGREIQYREGRLY